MQRCRLFSPMTALRVPLEVYVLVMCKETKKERRVTTPSRASGPDCGVSCIKPNTYRRYSTSDEETSPEKGKTPAGAAASVSLSLLDVEFNFSLMMSQRLTLFLLPPSGEKMSYCRFNHHN